MPVIEFRSPETIIKKHKQQTIEAWSGLTRDVEDGIALITEVGPDNLTEHEIANLTGCLVPLIHNFNRIAERILRK